MFVTTLSTVVTRWKQPKCPSTDEWINKVQAYIVLLCFTLLHFTDIAWFCFVVKQIEGLWQSCMFMSQSHFGNSHYISGFHYICYGDL